MAVSDRMYNSIALAVESQLLNGGTDGPKIEWGQPLPRRPITSADIINESILGFRKATPMATPKYAVSVSVSVLGRDEYRDSTTSTALISLDLTSDTLDDLLLKTHGHLELVTDPAAKK